MFDPYRRCLETCAHETAKGVLLSELLGEEDGPFPDVMTEKWFDIWRNSPRGRSVEPDEERNTNGTED